MDYEFEAPKINWSEVVQSGFIAGIILLFVGMVGMLATFHEREIVRDTFTLGQLVMTFIPFVAAFLVTRKVLTTTKQASLAFISGLIVAVITAIPSLILLGLTNLLPDMNSILVNVNRDWIETVTFDNRAEQLKGAAIFLGVVGSAGLLGTLLYFVPAKLRKSFIYASSFTLLIGVFGETVNLVLNQLLPDEVIDAIFRRDTLLFMPAIYIFILSWIGTLIWVFFGDRVANNSNAKRKPEQGRSQAYYIGMVLFGALLLALPWILGRTLSDVAVTVGLFVLMGFGLNIAIGLAGLLDLGYVTNYAVGAYILAVLTSTGLLAAGPEWLNFWMVLPISLLAAMLAGFVFAVPVLKMRGDYLAIATLGFGEIIGKLALSDWLKPIIGGAQGVLRIPKPVLFGFEFTTPESLYYIVLGACLLTLFVSIRLNNSRTGRQWMAIREDEDVAAAMGIDVARAKLLAFTLSAATGGLAGAIFAAKVGTVFPNSFTVFISINVLSLIIVGGMGSNPGIVLGAIALVGMPELLREFTEYRWLIYGALLIFMMVYRPEGLWPSSVLKREIKGDEEEPDISNEQVVVT